MNKKPKQVQLALSFRMASLLVRISGSGASWDRICSNHVSFCFWSHTYLWHLQHAVVVNSVCHSVCCSIQNNYAVFWNECSFFFFALKTSLWFLYWEPPSSSVSLEIVNSFFPLILLASLNILYIHSVLSVGFGFLLFVFLVGFFFFHIVESKNIQSHPIWDSGSLIILICTGPCSACSAA